MLSSVITRFISAALIATITISQNFAAEPSKSAEKNAAHNHQIKSQQFYANFQKKLTNRNDTYNNKPDDGTIPRKTFEINSIYKKKPSDSYASNNEREIIIKGLMFTAGIHGLAMPLVLPTHTKAVLSKHYEIIRDVDQLSRDYFVNGSYSSDQYSWLEEYGMPKATLQKWLKETSQQLDTGFNKPNANHWRNQEKCDDQLAKPNSITNQIIQDNEGYKNLIQYAKQKNWEQTDEIFKNIDKSTLSEKKLGVINAITQLKMFHNLPPEHQKEIMNNEAGADQLTSHNQTLKIEYLKLFSKIPTQTTVLVETRLNQYLDESIVLKLFDYSNNEEIRKIMHYALLDQVKQNGNRWPGTEQLKISEQFFLNLRDLKHDDNDKINKDLINLLFSTKISGNWEEFQAFCQPYLVNIGPLSSRKKAIIMCLEVYLADKNTENRQNFIQFSTPFTQGHNVNKIYALLPIYKAFPRAIAREAFMTFCAPHIKGLKITDQQESLLDLLRIYKSFTETQDRQNFIEFSRPYIAKIDKRQIPDGLETILPIYKAFPREEERAEFMAFCAPYIEGVKIDHQSSIMRNLLPIYQAFPEIKNRADFIKISEHFMDLNDRDYPYYLKYFLHIYKQFPAIEEINKFIEFCKPYLGEKSLNLKKHKDTYTKHFLPLYQSLKEKNKSTEIDDFYLFYIYFNKESNSNIDYLFKINDILSIYLAFTDTENRNKFLDFCMPYCQNLQFRMKIEIATKLIPIYQAFSTEQDRAKFLDFCKPYFQQEKNIYNKPYTLLSLIPIYKMLATSDEKKQFWEFYTATFDPSDVYTADVYTAHRDNDITKAIKIYQEFPNIEERDKFIDFSRPYLAYIYTEQNIDKISELIDIFKNKKDDFISYMDPHLERGIDRYDKSSLINSYILRDYLRFMRVDGALKVESVHQNRIQPMYETNINQQLPVLFAEDHFMAQAREMVRDVANAHDFDAIYELDRPILWAKIPNLVQGTTSHTIHNGANIIENHITNLEVEDFINYLDNVIAPGPNLFIDGKNITGAEVVSIIKQMLGLEQKGQNTSGGFAPYLGSLMYYAETDSPKGDEMLGRVWAFMKNLANKKPYANDAAKQRDDADNKKSVVLALLEASEISSNSVDTHCQTRTSGELFKLIAWHLPGSKLRPLIAADDLPSISSDDDASMYERIESAPFRAHELFNRMKREDSGEIRKVIKHQLEIDGDQPPLWKRYEAYYDDLYRRTKNDDGIGYKLDEHILTRDNRGNLVSKYQQDGTLRPAPVIVYYQAEFQVFEQTFSELMKKKFEEHRSLIY